MARASLTGPLRKFCKEKGGNESGESDRAAGVHAEATKAGIANVVGIAVSEAAAADDPVVYILTGEVFADSVGLDGITVDEAKAACRKLSIFLK